MTRLGIAALAAALAVGCAPARRSWVPTRPVAREALTAYAVVWSGTPLHVAPDRRAAVVQLPSEGYVPMRVLRERDGWAYLETLGEPADAHCAEGLPALEPFRLRLYAPASALVPVTAREIDQRFDDETAIHLARGVPLERLRGGLYRAHPGHATLVIGLSGADVGTRYLASPPIERPPTDRSLGARRPGRVGADPRADRAARRRRRAAGVRPARPRGGVAGGAPTALRPRPRARADPHRDRRRGEWRGGGGGADPRAPAARTRPPRRRPKRPRRRRP